MLLIVTLLIFLFFVTFKVIFKNKASRPYSFHLQGVYDRSQGAGFAQSHSSAAPPGVPGEPVAPGEVRTYNWRVTKKQGPTNTEFDCKTGAYYSTVDKVSMRVHVSTLYFTALNTRPTFRLLTVHFLSIIRWNAEE